MQSRPEPTATVLIASADSTAAALVGGLVETIGYRAEFAMLRQPPDAELRRIRPSVYMIDCATTENCTDEVIGRAMMRGVSVVLIGPQSMMRAMRDLAVRHDVEIVFTPIDPGPLGDALDRAARRSS